MKRASLIATFACLPTLAMAQGLPGMRGIDHVGMTVPDLAEAVTFFGDVLGCTEVTGFGPLSDPEGTFMQDLLGVDPKAVIEKVTLMRCGFGANLELFQYSAPDQQTITQKNSDIGAYHIAIYVDDIDAAVAYLDSKGVRHNWGPLPVGDGPTAGQKIIYFYAPWGLQMEAITYPEGMAYETGADTILWSPKAPAE
ncbi:VOC family protein [Pseudooceanicola sp. C21-150M6]|uniref:VOC family protein n=1 Tax=Pseudooceanicola sp. C21-150M6 TaxID=3434355 RepID=UPI003D7FFE6A